VGGCLVGFVVVWLGGSVVGCMFGWVGRCLVGWVGVRLDFTLGLME